MKIKVLYEDSNILAIDKPSGISVHSDGRSKKKTIVDWIFKNYPKMKNVGENETYENKKVKTEIKKPGIVHRLDRETSGILLLAKNQKAYQFLKSQFSAPALEIKQKVGLADRQNRVKKIYVAIVNGFVKNDHGMINKPIGRSPKDFRRHLSGRGARGEMREAITEYKVLKRFEMKTSQNFSRSSHSELPGGSHTNKNFEKFSFLELKPKTGRTHQIRVHMKFLNHPVACDSLYNPSQPCPKRISRLALHAKSIEFKNLKGNIVKIESPLPLDFKRVLK
ncbi:MAG: RluA family pseudouridine synthase [Patescibacteria group bacterium]